jgi:pyruvate/2-oxoglutarate dehydrogenase complex dihydrolipoamide dehydrogenase (E3) component
MQRFGSQVTVFVRGDKLLPKEDRDAAALVHASLEGDGVRFLFNSKVLQVETHPGECQSSFPNIMITYTSADPETREHLMASAILVATGRQPNVKVPQCSLLA